MKHVQHLHKGCYFQNTLLIWKTNLNGDIVFVGGGGVSHFLNMRADENETVKSLSDKP